MLTMLPSKYPEYELLVREIEFSQIAMFEVTPEVIALTDFSKGFGHAELITINV